MLRLKTDLNLINRFDVEAPDDLIASGVAETGTWVVKEGDTIALPSDGDVGAMQIFTESNRDGTAGWSPDATASHKNQLTVLWGKYRATTDQYAGTPSAGDPLKVNATGKLATTTASAGDAVAVCTKGAHTERHLQKDWTVIEYQTL